MRADILPADDPAALDRAARILQTGGLVAIPTETVYGLAADATNPTAVARIYAAKRRPRFNPLIVHVLDLPAAERHGEFAQTAQILAQSFWPGPLTLVVRRRPDSPVAELACAGSPNIALRAPAHAATRALLARVEVPLAAPSANRSGRVSPTRAAHVAEELGEEIDLILDGGPCELGLESTILAAEPGRFTLLRPGGVPRITLEALAGALEAPHGSEPHAPGMLASHYAPRAPLRLNAQSPEPGEAFLGFGPGTPAGAANLSPRGDLLEAAANLFALLRALDAQAPKAIAVAPIPEHGVGEAINDRLRRAAAPRET